VRARLEGLSILLGRRGGEGEGLTINEKKEKERERLPKKEINFKSKSLIVKAKFGVVIDDLERYEITSSQGSGVNCWPGLSLCPFFFIFFFISLSLSA